MQRRAKIVCTIGPASSSTEGLRSLVEAGMDVARLNFSHGSHGEHGGVIDDLRRIARERDRPIAILQDLQGPKIRIGTLADGAARLEAGGVIRITTEDIVGDSSRVSTSYEELPRDVVIGDAILLSDGLLRLEVTEVRDREVVCDVVFGGVLRSRAGMNLPGAGLGAPSLTDKDRSDLEFGMACGVDYVALSFVRTAADVEALAEILRSGESAIGIVAKLEKPQAIEHLDEILRVADAVMIARGDLGVELPAESVPFVQKEIIRRAAVHKVPVITATQMLESMVDHPRPTRAEASDVANAILDGTDAVMLSGETAIGRFPADAVATMDRIVTEAETHLSDAAPSVRARRADDPPSSFSDAMAQAASRVAGEIQARAIVAFTKSGFTARLISKCRPGTPIYAYTELEDVGRQLCLLWGVTPMHAEFIENADRMIESVDAALREAGTIADGDTLVVLGGSPSTYQGTTNLLKIHRSGRVP